MILKVQPTFFILIIPHQGSGTIPAWGCDALVRQPAEHIDPFSGFNTDVDQ